MEKNYKSKNGTSLNTETSKKIPIIQTLKPKKRYTKLEKELIEATKAAMEAIERNQKALEELAITERNAEI